MLGSEDDAFHDLCELAPTFLAVVVFLVLFFRFIFRRWSWSGRLLFRLWHADRVGNHIGREKWLAILLRLGHTQWIVNPMIGIGANRRDRREAPLVWREFG